MRINKYLASCGLASRRKVEEYILKGQVKINSKIASLADQVNPEIDRVEYQNKIIKPSNKTIVLFNKPKGVAYSMVSQDTDGCIADYIPKNLPKNFR